MGSPSSGSGLGSAVAAPMWIQREMRGAPSPLSPLRAVTAPGAGPATLRGPRRHRPLYRQDVWAWSYLHIWQHPISYWLAPAGGACAVRAGGGADASGKPGPGIRTGGAPGPGMGRRRGGGAGPAEACGVWLDTAELKRGPARVRPRRALRAGGPRERARGTGRAAVGSAQPRGTAWAP